MKLFSGISRSTCSMLASKMDSFFMKKGSVLNNFDKSRDILMLKKGNISAISLKGRKFI